VDKTELLSVEETRALRVRASQIGRQPAIRSQIVPRSSHLLVQSAHMFI